ncbi:hypothetical protein, partial [Dysgonomonas sp. UBA7710]|uniref:hypothetical protein n=1 Tax=Dysgonomonas sp. UBA7710 TaxID=1946428 RepID=UPI0025C06BFB
YLCYLLGERYEMQVVNYSLPRCFVSLCMGEYRYRVFSGSLSPVFMGVIVILSILSNKRSD